MSGTQTPQYTRVQERFQNIVQALQYTPGSKDNLKLLFVSKDWIGPLAETSEIDLVKTALGKIEQEATEYDVFYNMLSQTAGMKLVLKKLDTPDCVLTNPVHHQDPSQTPIQEQLQKPPPRIKHTERVVTPKEEEEEEDGPGVRRGGTPSRGRIGTIREENGGGVGASHSTALGEGQRWKVLGAVLAVVVAVAVAAVYSDVWHTKTKLTTHTTVPSTTDSTSHQDTISSSQMRPQPTGHGKDWRGLEPKEGMLLHIKFTDSEGKKQDFYLVEKIQTNCNKLGAILGINQDTLDGFDVKYRGDMEKFCQKVLLTWIARAEGKYPVTWGGLLEALGDAQLRGIAVKLEKALKFFYH